jgi:hypothetical protein
MYQIMTVISTKEFNTNQVSHLTDDMAVNGDVCIKRDKHLLYKPVNGQPSDEEQVILQPDDDFHRAITKDELLEGIYEDIAKRFAKK